MRRCCRCPPLSVLFVISAELAERFAFYGLSALLPVYMVSVLMLSEDRATTLLHAFKAAAYLSPVVGSVVADALLNRFRTIMAGVFVYALAMTFLAVMSFVTVRMDAAILLVSLLVIAGATGFIKSVVVALLGDQVKHDDVQLERSVSLFYSSIQLGSLLTFIVTPVLRTQIPPPLNFPIAFAVMATMLWLACGLFGAGACYYVIEPPAGSQILRLLRLVGCAVRRRVREPVPGRALFDYALPDYQPQEVADVAVVFRVLAVFATLPVFWSLTDQQSSRWIFQLLRMDTALPFGGLVFPPEAVGAANPILVLLLVPTLAVLVPWRSLRRMLLGYALTALSFVASGALEVFVCAYPGRVSMLWQLPQWILVCAGEVLVYLTGMQFALSEAPQALKAVMQAFFLFTISLGNMLVALLALVSGSMVSQTLQYFMFAGLMACATLVFFLQTRNYVARGDGAAQQLVEMQPLTEAASDVEE